MKFPIASPVYPSPIFRMGTTSLGCCGADSLTGEQRSEAQGFALPGLLDSAPGRRPGNTSCWSLLLSPAGVPLQLSRRLAFSACPWFTALCFVCTWDSAAVWLFLCMLFYPGCSTPGTTSLTATELPPLGSLQPDVSLTLSAGWYSSCPVWLTPVSWKPAGASQVELFLSKAVDPRGWLYWFSKWTSGLEGSKDGQGLQHRVLTQLLPWPFNSIPPITAHGMLRSQALF